MHPPLTLKGAGVDREAVLAEEVGVEVLGLETTEAIVLAVAAEDKEATPLVRPCRHQTQITPIKLPGLPPEAGVAEQPGGHPAVKEEEQFL